MLYKYTKINKYGAFTWEVKLSSLFKALIHESNNDSYIVEFYEWKLLRKKLQFTFLSDRSFEGTVAELFDRLGKFFQSNPKHGIGRSELLASHMTVLAIIPPEEKIHKIMETVMQGAKTPLIAIKFAKLIGRIVGQGKYHVVSYKEDALFICNATDLEYNSVVTMHWAEGWDEVAIWYVCEYKGEEEVPLTSWRFSEHEDQNTIYDTLTRTMSALGWTPPD